MTTRHSPHVRAHPLTNSVPDDLPAIQAGLAHAQMIPMRRDFPGGDPAAEISGTVRTAWSGSTVHFLAELQDDHIFTQAQSFNEPLWCLGDCFEMFLKFPGELPYLEFHVAPNNVVLQLLCPSRAVIESCRGQAAEEFIARFSLPRPAFISRTWPKPDERQWTVFASVDLRLLEPSLITLAGRELEFNLGRYDYPADQKDPILSCSSVLRELDFHAASDWGRLTLVAKD